MASLSGFLRNPMGYLKEVGVAAHLVYRQPPPTVTSDRRARTRIQVFRDLLAWKARYQTPGHDFFRFGLHLSNASHWKDVPPEHVSMRLRDQANRRIAVGHAFDYSALVGDKEVFLRLASGMGYPVPKLLAVLTPDDVCWLEPDQRRIAWEDRPFSRHHQLEGFCKPAVGGQGNGVFPLSISDGTLTSTNGTMSVRELRSRISARFLVEERLRQHSELARLHSASINTLRIVTVRSAGSVGPLAILIRIGVGRAAIDNVSKGGIAALVDADSGRIVGKAMRGKERTVVTHHPDTGVRIEGFEIPRLGEAVALVCRMHRDWPFFHSLGWDVAMTPEGPVVIEANDQWGLDYFTRADRGFGPRFLESLPTGLWNGMV